MIGEAGYETSEESSDFKDVREMRADKTQTWLSAGFGDDSPHEFVGTIMPASRAAEGKCAALHRFANAGGTLYSALYETASAGFTFFNAEGRPAKAAARKKLA